MKLIKQLWFLQVAEERYESLQTHCTGLEREVGDLRVELKETRLAVKEAESQMGGAELSSLRHQVRSNTILYRG